MSERFYAGRAILIASGTALIGRRLTQMLVGAGPTVTVAEGIRETMGWNRENAADAGRRHNAFTQQMRGAR